MARETQLRLPPEIAYSPELVAKAIHSSIRLAAAERVEVIRRSIDARHGKIAVLLRLRISGISDPDAPSFEREFKRTNPDHRVIIVGAGPAGLFAALRLIENGITPVILERGKDVRTRRRDLVSIHREHLVNRDSNYCFGEGGAGTYSDGKLYTRSTKRGNVASILHTLVQFGASEEILLDAHPHVGTNKLPGIISAMRECILECGGEMHFNSRVEDLIIQGSRAAGVILSDGKQIRGNAVILATGHSARDIFSLLERRELSVEFKPFAVGVRAEHPQALIDQIQYRCDVRSPFLPAAAYSLVHQSATRSAFSFCMCPGGIIAPCATAPGEVVTNGWSPSKRNNPWANSGIVVPVEWNDVRAWHNDKALAGIGFQHSVEELCWREGGETQTAPAQRMPDFVEGLKSSDLPSCSYQPGIASSRLDLLLPDFIAHTLRKAFLDFGKKMKGYYTDEAVLVAPESRTSSPVRIPRLPETLEHPDLKGLYPCGEGAGYAGGIVSAAMDGERCATMIITSMLARRQ